MPRAGKLKMVNGRLVSSRSRTGDPVCSQAMSAWQNIRRGNPAAMALDAAMKILGQCRAKARALKQAGQHRNAGNEAKAQALESRVSRGGPITAKDRLAKARELRASRSAKASGPAAYTQSPDQYQAAKGVKQPWIAEISPYQYSRMGKRQQTAYDKKRAAEWDASAGAKREWANKVLSDYKAGKIAKDTKGLHADARSVIIGQQIRDKKAAKEAKQKLADDRRVIRSPSELKPGQAIETTMYGKGTVAKVNRTSITFRNRQGDVRLPLREGGPAYARRTETPGKAAEVVARARELRAQRSARVSPDSPQAAQRLAEIRAKNAAGKAEAKPLHAQALEAARRVPAEKRVGEKVFVHHAWQEYRKSGGKLGLNEFKSGLANDLEGRRLMSRADLVQGMRPGDVKGSNVPYMGTNFNFIRTGQGGLGFGSKIQPREMVSRQRKDGKWITPVNEAERSKAAGLVAKLRAQRQPAPSLREQAAKHRASKSAYTHPDDIARVRREHAARIRADRARGELGPKGISESVRRNYEASTTEDLQSTIKQLKGEKIGTRAYARKLSDLASGILAKRGAEQQSRLAAARAIQRGTPDRIRMAREARSSKASGFTTKEGVQIAKVAQSIRSGEQDKKQLTSFISEQEKIASRLGSQRYSSRMTWDDIQRAKQFDQAALERALKKAAMARKTREFLKKSASPR